MEQFPIDQIQVGERLRDVDAKALELITASIRSEGQLQPIIVRAKPDGQTQLVAGLHRLRAMQALKSETIGVVWMPTTGDPALDDINAGIAECDENIARNELGQAMGSVFTGKRVERTSEREVLKLLPDAEKEKAAREVELSTAKTPKAKEAARIKLRDATRTVERLRARLSPAGDDPARKKPIAGVMAIVAKELGVTEGTVKNGSYFYNAFGQEILTMASRINWGGDDRADTKAELEALQKLRTTYPEDYDRLLASWRRVLGEKKGAPLRPSSTLRECYARDAADKASKEGTAGMVSDILGNIAETKSSLVDIRQKVRTLETKGVETKRLPSDLTLITNKLSEMETLLRSIRDVLKEGVR